MSTKSCLNGKVSEDGMVAIVAAIAVIVLALGLNTVWDRLHGTVDPTLVQSIPAATDITQRLDTLQNDITQLKAERLVDEKTIEVLAPKVVEGLAAKLRESSSESRAARSRADDLENKLQRLSHYAKDVEGSISKIDTGMSTPNVLEKKLEIQKASTRP